MNTESLSNLPSKSAKEAEFRKAIESGIANGWIRPPDNALERELKDRIVTERKREAMAKAQEVRLSKSKMESSKYYRTADQVGDAT